MPILVSGSKRLTAPRQVVWAALDDVAYLRPCIAGCEDLVRTGDAGYALGVGVGLALVRVKVNGTVTILDREQGRSYRLSGGGHAGRLGAATGGATITLSETRDGCRLTYRLEADVSGPLATVGTMFLSGVATAFIDQFLSTFQRLLATRTPPAFQAQLLGVPVSAARSRATMSSSQ